MNVLAVVKPRTTGCHCRVGPGQITSDQIRGQREGHIGSGSDSRKDQISQITGKDEIRSRGKIKSDHNPRTRILSDHDQINKPHPVSEST